MPSPLAIAQFARIVGRTDLLAQLGLPADAPVPASLTDEQRDRACLLATERTGMIAQALVEEAMANDNIQDATTAAAYLEERLTLFAPLLTDEARAAVRAEFLGATSRWS